MYIPNKNFRWSIEEDQRMDKSKIIYSTYDTHYPYYDTRQYTLYLRVLQIRVTRVYNKYKERQK